MYARQNCVAERLSKQPTSLISLDRDSSIDYNVPAPLNERWVVTGKTQVVDRGRSF